MVSDSGCEMATDRRSFKPCCMTHRIVWHETTWAGEGHCPIGAIELAIATAESSEASPTKTLVAIARNLRESLAARAGDKEGTP